MKKYENLYLNIVYLNKLDVICTSGPQKDGEFDDEDIFGE